MHLLRKTLPALIIFALCAACTPPTQNTQPRDVGLDTHTDTNDEDTTNDTTIDTAPDSPPSISNTDAQLQTFYAQYGPSNTFPELHTLALEALLRAEDDIVRGDIESARTRVETVFAHTPHSDPSWYLAPDAGTGGSNIGHPVAYYGLRMIEQIVQYNPAPTTDTLQMTGVVAMCADARRPRKPDLQPENVTLHINPLILEDNARRLFLSTHLFRLWVQAITQGVSLELTIHVLDTCARVDYTDDGSVVVMYPDTQEMIDAVPEELANTTDMWWVISPSGVIDNGAGMDRHFITGGMGLSNDGRPLFISDDLWFTDKLEHIGTGPYTEAEIRAYQPQWFQHEFMHHLFRTWPDFELEVTSHQWFDRSTWPADFQGSFEPDYYSEAIQKRLLSASPTLAEGLNAPEFATMRDLAPSDLAGSYTRQPVENGYHEVTVELSNDALRWVNAAGVSWSLEVRNDALWTGEDCPYGAQPVRIQLQNDRISALWFGGEAYTRTP